MSRASGPTRLALPPGATARSPVRSRSASEWRGPGATGGRTVGGLVRSAAAGAGPRTDQSVADVHRPRLVVRRR